MGIRLLATAFLLALFALPMQATSWSPVAERVLKSIVMVENKTGSCTGFVINSSRKNKDNEDVDLVMTAAHCDGPELYADRRPARIAWKDEKKDLLVLEVEDTERPALQVAKSNPNPADEVMVYGFGYGLERPMLRVTTISDNKTYIPEGGIGGPLLVTDLSFVSGQSGGPVVNDKGEVVMIVQMGTNVVGLGVGCELIRDRAGRYLEKPQAVKP